MQYEHYQNRIKKVASFLGRVYAARIAIVISLAAIMALTTALVATKGMILSEASCPAEVTYGEAPGYRVFALLESVTYEYREKGEEAWSASLPDSVGEYEVRSVSTSSFGNPRYGKIQAFTVIPREITPSVADARVVYGEAPRVDVDTVSGDLFSCAVVYESIEWTETREARALMRVDAASVVISDTEGNDRADCYVIKDTPVATVLLDRRPLEITVRDAQKEYDGLPLTFDGYEISDGTLAEGDSLIAVFDDSITSAGQLPNTPILTVLNPENQEITSLYSLTVESGVLTVDQRPLIIETGSLVNPYNGAPQSNPEFRLTEDSSPLVEGHHLTVRNAPVLWDCGTIDNLLSFSITDSKQNEYGNNYAIFLKAGTLQVTQRDITVQSGDLTVIYDGEYHSNSDIELELPGSDTFYIRNNAFIRDAGSMPNEVIVEILRDGQDVTANYNITYEYGTLTVERRPITVQIAEYECVYNGKEQSFASLGITDCFKVLGEPYGLVDEYVLYMEVTGSTLFGDVDVHAVEDSIRITWQYANGLDSSDSVPIESIEEGTTYGETNKHHEESTVGLPTPDLEPEDPYDATANYIVTVLPGRLTVTQRPIVVAAASASKDYDGEPLLAEGCELVDGSLVSGHALQGVSEGSITDVGTVPSIVVEDATRILDGGDDVTAYYAISYVNGSLWVQPCNILVSTASGEWVYDGTVHEGDTTLTLVRVLNNGKFVEGHTLVNVIDPIPSIQNVGWVQNMAVVQVMDGDVPVTNNYAIMLQIGKLVVTRRPLVIQTPTRAWVYDGYVHPLPEEHDALVPVIKEGYSLAPNESMQYAKLLNRLLDVSEPIKNVTTVTVYNQSGQETTPNYEISYEYGTLAVVPRPITVRTPDREWVWDGIPRSVEGPYSITADSPNPLVDGHQLLADPDESDKTYVDVNEEGYANDRRVWILDSAGNRMNQENYEITYRLGTIRILRRPLVIRLDGGEKTYDDQPVTEWTIVYTGEYLPLAGHVVEVKPMVSPTDAGEYSDIYPDEATLRITAAGEDMLQNYRVTFEPGACVIQRRPLAVRSYSDVKLYDGTPLTRPEGEWILVDGSMPPVEGHLVSVNAFGSAVDIGIWPNTLDSSAVRVTNAAGDDKTANYVLIVLQEGTLTIREKPYVLRVETASAAKTYDGMPLVAGNPVIDKDVDWPEELFRESVRVTGSQTKVGSSENTATVKVYYRDRGMEIPTDLVKIEVICGTLTVHEKMAGEDGEGTDTVFGYVRTLLNMNLYLRMASYGDFNGQEWSLAPEYDGVLPDGYGYQYLTSIALQKLANQGVYPIELRDMEIFMLPYYDCMDGMGPVIGSDTMNNEVYTSYMVNAYVVGDSLELIARYMALSEEERAQLLGDYADEEAAYRAHVYQHYLNVLPSTREYLQTVILEKNFNVEDPRIIGLVAAFIQNSAEYNLDYPSELDGEADRVVAFLDQYKQGKCTHYAEAATMLYRTLGIPARYTVGFMKETLAGELTEISNPGHAWVEVYLDGMGWVPVEVTAPDGQGTGGSGGSGGTGEDIRIPLEITPLPQYKIYDGLPLYAVNELLMTEQLRALNDQGYRWEVEITGSRVNAGRGQSTITSFKLTDVYGRDVTSQYKVICLPGELNVKPIAIEILLYPVSKEYDGLPATWGDEDYELLSIPDGLVLEWLDIHIPLTDVGVVDLFDLNRNAEIWTSFCVLDSVGADVTGNYSLEFVWPEELGNVPPLEITPRRIELTAASETRVYDGEPLTNATVNMSSGPLVSGHTWEAFAVGVQTTIGSSVNRVDEESVRVWDENGVDVTKNYYFEYKDGLLELIEEP
ncbi:MAG: transglutaminase domain-containing protein [Ruminococcaceae bacterium]|nr:transglutaminase domain-containing protein [Oscillospiraceae bacterium]